MICLRFSWREHGKSNCQNGWFGDCMEIVWRVVPVHFIEILW